MIDPLVPPSPTPDADPIGRHVARGLSWAVADIWGRQALNFIVFVVLANALAPTDFGLVALASVFVAFAQMFVDQGMGDALIQRRDVEPIHMDTAFWVAVATGALLTAAFLVLAIPISIVLGQPDLQLILQGLSLTFVLSAITSVQVGLLRRQLAFRSLAIRSMVSALAGGAIGVALAYNGAGPWALVGQQLVAAAASVVTLWWVLPWRPSLRISGQAFRELFAFGIRVVGSDVMSFFTRNTDNLLVGAFLGTGPLGLYALAFRILDTTQALLINIARKVAFPGFARLQHDPERLERAYLRVTRLGAVTILPAYLGLAAIAPELIVALFGQRWAASGTIATVLYLSGPVLTLQAFTGALLYAVGHPEVFFRFRLITTATTVAGFVVALSSGTVAVAASLVVVGYALIPLNLVWLQRYGGIPARKSLSQLRGPLAASLVMVVAVLAARALAADRTGLAGTLAVEVGVGVVAYVVAIRALDRRALEELLAVVGTALPFAAPALVRVRRVLGLPAVVRRARGPLDEPSGVGQDDRHHEDHQQGQATGGRQQGGSAVDGR